VGHIAFVAFSGDVKGGGVSVVGRGAALLGEDSAQLGNLLNQRSLHGAVGAEESSVLAVLIHINLNVLRNPGLSAGNAGITRGIGSGSFYILNAQLCAAGLEAGLTGGDGSVAQMALEGNVNEGLGAHGSCLVNDSGAH